MPSDTQLDSSVLTRLPLPLAQLYRRAHNAQTPAAQHQAAFYAFEAALKLLASTAVVEYADHPHPHPDVVRQLEPLARPSLGQWWGFAKCLIPVLAPTRPAFEATRAFLFDGSRKDCPALAHLAAVLAERGGPRQTPKAAVDVAQLFNDVVAYRNYVIGHGASGLHSDEQYVRAGRAMRLGLTELFGRPDLAFDVLAGHTLLYVGPVTERQGVRVVPRWRLVGPLAERLEDRHVRRGEGEAPEGDRVYLTDADERVRLFHPLAEFDCVDDGFYLLNSVKDKKNAEFLNYIGGLIRRVKAADRNDLLARVMHRPVSADETRRWEDAAEASDESPPRPAGGAATRPTPEEADPQVRKLGGFELVSELGRGGAGVVYRAWQDSLQRQVAVKVLDQTADAVAAARFHREVRAHGKVDHPHVVKVYASGTDADYTRHYLAMELLAGASVAHVLDEVARDEEGREVDANAWERAVAAACERVRGAEKPVTPEQLETPAADEPPPPDPPPAVAVRRLVRRGYVERATELMRQVATAAHTLHDAGIVHRDIKPGNIQVSPDGRRATLMDLGLAHLKGDGGGRLTVAFVGTPRYSSLQQLEDAKQADPRNDVYSLGATLWELLTLQPLHGAAAQTNVQELLNRLKRSDPTDPRAVQPEVPGDLAVICLKCLEDTPERRYQTAGEVADDIARWQQNRPILAKPSTRWQHFVKRVQRNRRLSAAVAAAVVLFLAGFAGVTWQWLRANGEATTAKANEKRAGDEKQRADNEARDAKNSAAEAKKQTALARDARNAALLEHSYQACGRNDLPTAEKLLEDLTAEEQDNPETRYVQALIRRKASSMFGKEEGLAPLRLDASTDGRFVACEYAPPVDFFRYQIAPTVGGFGKVTVFRTADRTPVLTVPVGGLHHEPHLSRDGRRVVSMRTDNVACVWDATTGRMVGEYPTRAADPKLFATTGSVLALSPDGTAFVTCTLDGLVERRELKDGARTHRHEFGFRVDSPRVPGYEQLHNPTDALTLQCLSADGLRVRLCGPNSERECDLATGTAVAIPFAGGRRVAPVPARPAEGVEVSAVEGNARCRRVEVQVRETGSGRVPRWFTLPALNTPVRPEDLRFTGDGRFVNYFGNSGHHRRCDTLSGATLFTADIDWGVACGLHDGGLSVLHADAENPLVASLEQIDPRTGLRRSLKTLRLRPDLPTPDAAPSWKVWGGHWHPTGRWVVVVYEVGDGYGFEIWDAAERKCTRRFTPLPSLNGVRFSADSDRVLVQGANGWTVYSATTGEPLSAAPTADPLTGWRLASDGTRLVTWHADGSGRLWGLPDGAHVARFADSGGVWDAPPQFCAGGEQLVARRNGRLEFWSARTGRRLGSVPLPVAVDMQAAVTAVVGTAAFPPTAGSPLASAFPSPDVQTDSTLLVTPDGRRVVVWTPAEVRVYDADTRAQVLAVLRYGELDELNLRAGREVLFTRSVSTPKPVVVGYDTDTLKRIPAFDTLAIDPTQFDQIPSAVTKDPSDPQRWAVAEFGSRVRLVTALGHEPPVLVLQQQAVGLEFAHEGSQLNVRTLDDVIGWQPWGNTPYVTASRPNKGGVFISGSAELVNNGTWVAHSAVSHTEVMLTDLTTAGGQHSLPLSATAFAWLGEHTLAVGGEAGLNVWDLSALSESVVALRVGPRNNFQRDTLYGVAWAPDGTSAVAVGQGWQPERYAVTRDGRFGDAALVRDDTRRGGPQVGHVGQVFGVAYTPDGKRFATTSFDGTVQVWETATLKPVFQIDADLSQRNTYRYAVVFDPTGRWLLTARDAKPLDGPADVKTLRPQAIKVYDADTGREVRAIRGHDDVIWQIAFDHTGGRVVTCGQDKLARVWDFDTGDELFQLAGHGDWVLTAKFTPDGQRVVTGGRDNKMKVWDADTRAVLVECKHPSSVAKVCVTADGSRAVTACGDGRVRFCNLHTGQVKLTLVASKKPLWALNVSRDESRLLTGGEDGELRAWPLDHPVRLGLPPEAPALLPGMSR